MSDLNKQMLRKLPIEIISKFLVYLNDEPDEFLLFKLIEICNKRKKDIILDNKDPDYKSVNDIISTLFSNNLISSIKKGIDYTLLDDDIIKEKAEKNNSVIKYFKFGKKVIEGLERNNSAKSENNLEIKQVKPEIPKKDVPFDLNYLLDINHFEGIDKFIDGGVYPDINFVKRLPWQILNNNMATIDNSVTENEKRNLIINGRATLFNKIFTNLKIYEKFNGIDIMNHVIKNMFHCLSYIKKDGNLDTNDTPMNHLSIRNPRSIYQMLKFAGVDITYIPFGPTQFGPTQNPPLESDPEPCIYFMGKKYTNSDIISKDAIDNILKFVLIDKSPKNTVTLNIEAVDHSSNTEKKIIEISNNFTIKDLLINLYYIYSGLKINLNDLFKYVYDTPGSSGYRFAKIDVYYSTINLYLLNSSNIIMSRRRF